MECNGQGLENKLKGFKVSNVLEEKRRDDNTMMEHTERNTVYRYVVAETPEEATALVSQEIQATYLDKPFQCRKLLQEEYTVEEVTQMLKGYLFLGPTKCEYTFKGEQDEHSKIFYFAKAIGPNIQEAKQIAEDTAHEYERRRANNPCNVKSLSPESFKLQGAFSLESEMWKALPQVVFQYDLTGALRILN
ncbi:hypothetical protein JW711_04900 [Candidatus Woesearchaeota archaeon]|nr:hypothetical protein [Candidatus Woesearchaeota archaeon]